MEQDNGSRLSRASARGCCSVRLHSVTPGVTAVPEVPAGQLSSSSMLMFQEVWGRSFCRTIERLVEVVQEYPTEVEHIYSPSCVPLVRCAGCCGDEKLECHPTHTTNVTMQVSDPSQVTAVATKSPDAVWLIIYFQPSDSIKSLLRSSISTVSAARDSNSWVVLPTCPPADGQSLS
ncbi:hypothetical protein PAMP_005575 [Pampus punctatissimus]